MEFRKISGVTCVTYVPVFIDGPLKGKRQAVDESAIRYGLAVAQPPGFTVADFWTRDLASTLTFQQVYYTFHRFGMLGRILVVGTTLPISSQEAEDAAFEMLASDAAKAAVAEMVPRERPAAAGSPQTPAPAAPAPATPPAEPSSHLSPDDALRLIDQAIAEQADFARPPRQRTREDRAS